MTFSTLKPSKIPMKSSAIRANTADRLTVKVIKPMRSKRPKSTPIRRAARGQDCTLRIPGVCNFNPETTVWCHSNEYRDGKGMGLKADDREGCFGCSCCHAYYDGGYANMEVDRETVRVQFNAARILSRSIIEMMGLLK